MKKLLLLLLMVGAMSTVFANPVKLTGTIDDSMCAAKGKCDDKDPVACASKCIKMGASAVLVVDKKSYKIANQKKAVKFAGKKVTVEGNVTGDSIDITSIAEAK